jgi:hypothetical protein
MMLETRKKYTTENKSRKQMGGGPLLIIEHSVVVQEMMEIAGRHYFEGDDIDECGEVCILH